MEERFLRGVPAADELDVIDHKDVASAVFLPETVALLIALAVHHFHKLVDDGLGVGVHHLGLRGVFEEIVADGVQKVSFPKPHPAVNEEGIVFSRRVLRHRLCGCESILVGFPLHECVKGVFFQERIGFLFLFFGVFLVNDQPAVGQGNALFFEIFPLLFLDNDLDIGDKRIKGGRDFTDLIQIAAVNGLFGDGGLCGKHESAVHKTHGFQRLDPHIVAYRLHGFGKLVFDVVPKFFFSDHRRYYN